MKQLDGGTQRTAETLGMRGRLVLCVLFTVCEMLNIRNADLSLLGVPLIHQLMGSFAVPLHFTIVSF
jgi:hypothetical protein